jgi:hypothetical protein
VGWVTAVAQSHPVIINSLPPPRSTRKCKYFDLLSLDFDENEKIKGLASLWFIVKMEFKNNHEKM